MDLIVQWVPMACTFAMGVLLVLLLVRYFSEPFVPNLSFGELLERLRDGRPALPPEDGVSVAPRRLRTRLRHKEFSRYQILKQLGWIFSLMVISRGLMVLIGVVGSALQGNLAGYLSHFADHWVRWDADHYLGLATNWYVNEGDPRLHLVFYPLYPGLVYLVKYLFLGNVTLAATVVSNVCLLWSGYFLYLIVLEDQGERAARRAVRYLMFCPLSLFLSIPYSESLFLMLTLLAVLLARRRWFGLAVLVGALAANTRVLGLFTAVPIYIEMLRHVAARKLWPRRKGRTIALVTGYTLMASLVAAGFGLYLVLNWSVSGNPFQFLIYQSEHWGQRFGSFTDTLRYSLEYAFTYDDLGTRLGTWIPQSVFAVATVGLIGCTANRVHPGDGAYAWLYLFSAFSATWLLSGPRYLMACYALYPMMALVTKKKWQDGVMTGTLLVLMVYFVYLYTVVGCVL